MSRSAVIGRREIDLRLAGFGLRRLPALRSPTRPLPVVLVACAEDDGIATAPAASTQVRPGVHRQYGAPVQVGDGRAERRIGVNRLRDTHSEIVIEA